MAGAPALLLDPGLSPVWQEAQRLPDEPGPNGVEQVLRHAEVAGVPREVARAVVQQVLLRRRAAGKLGTAAPDLLLTREGLEQASRPVVAGRRALRLAEVGARSLTDLGCGIGIDSLAAARVGLQVLAVEQDEPTAAVARVNLRAWPLARVVTGDAMSIDVPDDSVAFVDPGRRTGHHSDGTTRRTFDPQRWQPPWAWVTALAAAHPRTLAKAAPGLPHDLVPSDAEAEWVSVAGDLVEVSVWFGALAREPGARAAVVLAGSPDPWTPGPEHRLSEPVEPAPVGSLGAWLLDPDPAVVRAHQLTGLCRVVDGRLVSSGIAYVTTDQPRATPFARAWPVEDVVPADPRVLRGVLRARGVGRVEIRTRGLDLDPTRFRRALRLPGRGESAHVAMTRVQGKAVALLLGSAAEIL